jgi:hypothetical protein
LESVTVTRAVASGVLETNERCTLILAALPEQAKAVRAALYDVVKVRGSSLPRGRAL